MRGPLSHIMRRIEAFSSEAISDVPVFRLPTYRMIIPWPSVSRFILTYTSVWRATSSVMGKTATLFIVSVLSVTVIIIPTVIPIPRSFEQWWFLRHNVYYSMVIIIRMNPWRETFSWNSFIVVSPFRPHFISSICHFLSVLATPLLETHSITRLPLSLPRRGRQLPRLAPHLLPPLPALPRR